MTHSRNFASAIVALSLFACDPTVDPSGDASIDGALADGGTSVDAEPADAGTLDGGSVATPDASGDGGEPDAGTTACDPAALDAGSFVDAYRDGLCEKYRVCAPYTVGANEICSPSVFELAVREWSEGLTSGELRLVPERACRCLDELRNGTCQLWTAILACAGVIEHVATSVCASSSDCNVDQTCDRSGGVCPGACIELPGEGMPCHDGLLCDLGLRCVGGSCIRPGWIGAPCEEYDDCAIDLYCDQPDNAVPGTCRGPAELGERCGGNAYCVAGLVCDGDVCGPGQALGQSCSGLNRCALGLRCTDGTCTRFLGPGEACASDRECWSGFRCDGTCQPLPIIGEPCPLGSCYLGTCVEGTCVRSAAGAPCSVVHISFVAECDEGLYCDTGTSTCTAGVGAGDPCFLATQCPIDLTCDATGHCGPADCVL